MKKLVTNPYNGINWSTIGRYKANLHTHTTESDGWLFGAEVVERYKNASYDILVITDHDDFRPDRSPRTPGYGGVHYVNSWPWSIWEGEEDYQAPPGTLEHRTVEEEYDPITGIVANGMLTVEGVEYSEGHHICSFDNKFPGKLGYTEEELLKEDFNRVGLTMIAHPGRHPESLETYVEWYKKYPSTFGLEVYNQGNRHPNDIVMWDRILRELMPYRPVWGCSNDDMHTTNHLFKNYQYMLMPELNRAEFRHALKKGASIFSWEYDGSGEALAPTINEIVVDEDSGTIEIDASNYNKIEWVYGVGGQSIRHIGEKFNYKDSDNFNNYIRAQISNEQGITHTQPFGFIDVESVETDKVIRKASGGLHPPIRP